MSEMDKKVKSKRTGIRIPEYFLVRFAGGLGAFLMIVVAGLIVTDILSRRFSDTPLQGMTGYAQILTVAAVYLGMGEALRTDQHVSVGIVVVRLPERLAQIAAVLRAIVVLTMGSYFTYAAYLSARASYERTEAIGGAVDLIIWPGRAAVVLGTALLTLAMVERVLRRDTRTVHEKTGLGTQ